MKNQIKSKQRVFDHGEVFTAEREVNSMLDLVKHETERVDSRFLEPACGDGNFLIEILRRKLTVAFRLSKPPRKKKTIPKEYEKQSVIAVASLYGVDLLMDNVISCRNKIYALWEQEYEKNCADYIDENCKKTVRYILEKNIVCGNALSLKQVDLNGKDLDEPIVFSEWSFITSNRIQKKDFRFDKLLAGDYEPKIKNRSNKSVQLDLFDSISNKNCQFQNEDEPELLKSVIADYRKISEYEK